jgi:CDP-diglyceride synthetase
LFLAIAGSIVPRVTTVFLWIFTDAVSDAFNGFIIPLLGIIFLPFTTMIYVISYSLEDGSLTWGWVAVIIAVLIDIGNYAGGAYGKDKTVTVR